MAKSKLVLKLIIGALLAVLAVEVVLSVIPEDRIVGFHWKR
jgi:hypothetical protein